MQILIFFFLQLCNVQQGNSTVVSILVIFIVVADGDQLLFFLPFVLDDGKKKTFFSAATVGYCDDWIGSGLLGCCYSAGAAAKSPPRVKKFLTRRVNNNCNPPLFSQNISPENDTRREHYPPEGPRSLLPPVGAYHFRPEPN